MNNPSPAILVSHFSVAYTRLTKQTPNPDWTLDELLSAYKGAIHSARGTTGASQVLADEIDERDPTEAEIKESNKKTTVDMEALDALKEALKLNPSAANAMALVLLGWPNISRKSFFHTAVAAGINIRTAKNYFDRNNIGA